MSKSEEKADLVDKLDYYERLLEYLDDMGVRCPNGLCLDELIAQFDEDEE